MTRFPMTLGRLAQVVTGLVAVLLVALLFVPLQQLPLPLMVSVPMVLGPVAVTLLLAILWAPRAVRLEQEDLLVERLFWPAFRIPLRDIELAEEGPVLRMVNGEAKRVAGNGGLMGFTGLFWVKSVGVARMWATRLGTPTVLLRRRSARPVVLGVDDSAALLDALRKRLPAPTSL